MNDDRLTASAPLVCAVLGAGSFGTALAQVLATKHPVVRLWCRRPQMAEHINEHGHNPAYLKAYPLQRSIKATSDLQCALRGATLVVVAVPSHALRDVVTALQPHVRADASLVIATKGLEQATLMTMDEVALDVLGAEVAPRLLALSGPSFADEIMQRMPTAVVLAGSHEARAQEVAEAMATATFRSYVATDVTGVQMAGALKNVMAIAAGAIAGLGCGENTRAALLTRSLAEITRLAVAKGALPLTLLGLAGVGDLFLTCNGPQSRNRAFGYALGQQTPLSQLLQERQQVVEGVQTTRAAYQLARRLNVETPIINAVYQVLYENRAVAATMTDFLARASGRELDWHR